MSFQAQVVKLDEKLACFDMETTVPIKQKKNKVFFAKIFDITLHVIISGIGMREKRGIQRHRGERGGGREEARDTERIRPIKGRPPLPIQRRITTSL